jgi:hypothetical protein
MDKPLLTIELVPESSWYNNVRSKVDRKTWDIIRRKCYSEAHDRCEICGDTSKNQGLKHNVECHEIWQYDDINHIQELTGFIALCNHCHLCKHPGYAETQGAMNIVIMHLIQINKMTQNDVLDMLTDSMRIWRRRSQHSWTVDISYIDSYKNNNIENKESLIF